jgi:MoxR-like ATPase
MSNSKFPSDRGWKDVASKNKIKENGLLKVLADHKRVDTGKFDDVLESLDQILKLAAQLKKAKDVTASSGAAKYVADLADAAESDPRVVIKAKAEAEKNADADAKKRGSEDQKSAKSGEDEGEDAEASALLTTKLVPLLREVNKGRLMHALTASTGKQVVVMLSRKPIPPARRKLRADPSRTVGSK